MTSKIIVNTIEADTGISSVTFASNINLQNNSSVLVSSSGVTLGTGSTIAAPSANEITLSTNSAERLRITSGGKISINNTNPLSDLHVTTTGSSGQDGTFRVGGSVVSLGLVLDYDQSGSTVSRITANPTYTSTSSLLKICVDGDANPDQLVLRGDGNVGVNASTPERKLEVVDTAGSLTYPIAVSNHTDASAGVGAGIAFHLTAGGNTRGELGLVYAGNSNSDGTDFVFRPNDGSTGQVERLRIEGSSGRVGINTNSATARFDINHPNTEQGLVVRSRYGNIATAMVKFDGDPNSNGGDGNVLHLHGGNSRTDSEILHIDSTGVGDIFDIRGDGLTRVYKQLQLEHSSNVAKIIFNEYGANDIKAQIEMDQINGSSGQLIFRTQNSGTLSERMRITNAGYVLKSDTPAFKCKLSGATGANFTGVLVFNSVQYNIGSHYNSSNGRFTAPVDGRYLFAWYTNMERAGGNGSFYADWKINGNNQGNRMYTHHSGAWEQICGTVIFDLNANDYVEINAITSGNWDGGSYGSYSGYLLG